MINHTGLTDQALALIRGVIKNHGETKGAMLFGSRAKGTALPTSDIDIALMGIADPLKAEAIARELEELPLPYKFDVKAFDSIQSHPLREHIERVGISILED